MADERILYDDAGNPRPLTDDERAWFAQYDAAVAADAARPKPPSIAEKIDALLDDALGKPGARARLQALDARR